MARQAARIELSIGFREPLLNGGPELEIMHSLFLQRAGRGTVIEKLIRAELHEILPLNFDAILQRLSGRGYLISRKMLSHHLRIMIIFGHIGLTLMGLIKIDCEENHPVRIEG